MSFSGDRPIRISCPGRIVNDCPPSDTRTSLSSGSAGAEAGLAESGVPAAGTQKLQPSGAGGQAGSGCQPSGGTQSAGGRGQPGAGLNVKPAVPAWSPLEPAPG